MTGVEASKKGADGLARPRRAKIRRDLRQGNKHESPRFKSGVRQRRRTRLDEAAIGEEIKIERSRGVLAGPGPAEGRLDRMKAGQQISRRRRCGENRGGVDKGRVGWIGPGRK